MDQRVLSDVILRLATCDDVRAIAEVQLSSWRTTYRNMGIDRFLDTTTVEDRVPRWTSTLCDPDKDRDPRMSTFVAVVDHKVVGFVFGGPERTVDPEYSGELYAIYLLQPYQRRGIGQQLLRVMARSLSESGFTSMLLWALTANQSGRYFYEACGGQVVRERQIEWAGATLDEVGYDWHDIRQIV